MSSKWIGRLPALSGAVFGVVGFLRGGGDDNAPTASSSGQQIASYAHHHPLPGLAYQVELWAFLALVIFSVVIYSRLREVEPTGIAGLTVVAACVISVAIKLASFPATYALYTSPNQLSPDVARALWTVGSFAFVISMLVQALFLGAVAVAGLLFGGIPRWVAATAAAIAIALLAGFTLGQNFQVAPTLAWILWTIVASVALFLRVPQPAGSTYAVQPALSSSAP